MTYDWTQTSNGRELAPCCRSHIGALSLAAPDAVLRVGESLECDGCGETALLFVRGGTPVWVRPVEPKRRRKEKPCPPTPALMGVRGAS